MDDSYAKSFERAVEMLTELESKSVLKPIGEDKLKEVVTSTEGGRRDVSGSMDSRRWVDGQNKEPVLSDKHIRGSDCGSHFENQGNFACSLSSQQNGVDNYWRKGLCFENPGERSTFSSKMKENWIGSTGKGLASANKLMLDSPAAVLYTQPKRVSWRFGEGGQRRVGWEEDSVEKPYKQVSHSVRKLDGGLLDSTDENSEAELSKSQSSFLSPTERNWRERSWTEVAQGKSTGAAVLLQFSQPRIKSDSQQASCRRNARESGDWTRCTKEDSNICPKYHLEQTIVVDDPRQSEASIDGKWGQSFGINVSGKLMVSTDNVGDRCLGKNSSSNKSWADKVGEEEQKILRGKDLSRCFDDAWNYEEESNDENQDSNTIHGSTCPKSPVEAINQKFEAFDLRDGYDTFINAVSPRNPTVRRSLCFDAKNDLNMRKKNRLQVFQDITPSPDSP
ncbi:hypothetical protein GH714_041220 [Hevea brasiliensis]|nr:hypothetical protein GH714_041220 [Hevea brasiliensis]